MKKIFWWVIGGVVVYFLYSKVKGTQAATTQKAAAGITSNPTTSFWDFSNAQSATQSAKNINDSLTSAGSILTNLGAHFGGTSPASGKASPTNSGSGAGGPSQSQINSASAGNASASDDSDDFGGESDDLGDDDSND